MKPEKIKTILKWSINVAVFIVLITFMEGAWFAWGFLGWLIIIFGLPLFRFIQNRKTLMGGLRNVESSIFGKPLDRSLWKKGELKNTKIEPYWRGKPLKISNLLPKPKTFTNKHMAATFFAFFFMFFAIFLANWYSINLIFAMVFLMLSLHFKQSQLIRETQEMIKNEG